MRAAHPGSRPPRRGGVVTKSRAKRGRGPEARAGPNPQHQGAGGAVSPEPGAEGVSAREGPWGSPEERREEGADKGAGVVGPGSSAVSARACRQEAGRADRRSG